jgi:hypothetical protein
MGEIQKEKKESKTEELLRLVPAKVYEMVGDNYDLKMSLNAIAKRGATAKQQMQYVSLVAGILNQGKDNQMYYDAVSLLNAMITNPSFSFDKLSPELGERMIAASKSIYALSEGFGQEFTDLFFSIIKNKNFDPEECISRKFIKHFVSIMFTTVREAGEISSSLVSVMNLLESKKFTKPMLDDLETLTKLSQGSSAIAMDLLSCYMKNENFSAARIDRKTLKKLSELSKELEQYGLPKIAIESMLRNKHVDISKMSRPLVEHVSKAMDILEKYDSKNYTNCVSIALSFMESPSFDPTSFNENSAKSLTSFVDSLMAVKGKLETVKYLKKFSYSKLGQPSNLVRAFNNYSAGRDLAKKVGAHHNSPEVCLNFAYAINKFGEEKTAALYSEFNIEYFARYGVNTLEEMYEKASGKLKDERPVMVVFATKDDHNGAFYHEIDLLREPSQRYSVLIVEVDKKEDLQEKAKWLSRKYGKIDVAMFSFHGKSSMFTGSASRGGGEFLTTLDEAVISSMKDSFNPAPILVFDSCSTGGDIDAISAKFSELLHAKSFAPDIPFYSLSWSFNKNGQISDVTYHAADENYVGSFRARIFNLGLVDR